MTAQKIDPVGLIDVSAIEHQARAARAEMSREAFAAMGTLFKQWSAKFRPGRQSQPQSGAFA